MGLGLQPEMLLAQQAEADQWLSGGITHLHMSLWRLRINFYFPHWESYVDLPWNLSWSCPGSSALSGEQASHGDLASELWQVKVSLPSWKCKLPGGRGTRQIYLCPCLPPRLTRDRDDHDRISNPPHPEINQSGRLFDDEERIYVITKCKTQKNQVWIRLILLKLCLTWESSAT